MLDLDALPYIPAAHQAPRSNVPTLVVIHDGETPESHQAAEGMAAWFASGRTIGSTQIVLDDDSIIRCVPDTSTANGAAGANSWSLHIEIAGRASQSAADWQDTYSQAAIRNAARVTAAWCARYAIPVRHLTVDEVRAKTIAGICGHKDVTAAFGVSTHTDPGPNFPWAQFLQYVEEEIDMPLTETDINAVTLHVVDALNRSLPPLIAAAVEKKLDEDRAWFEDKDGARKPGALYGALRKFLRAQK